MTKIPVAFFDTSPGDRIRIALSFVGSWRFIFWMKVSKDGSVYLGPRLRNITTVRQGVKRVEEGKLSIRYEEGQEVASHHKAKISFHASGHINTSGSRLLRNSIREIKNQQELCRVLFRHPSHFPPGSNLGSGTYYSITPYLKRTAFLKRLYLFLRSRKQT